MNTQQLEYINDLMVEAIKGFQDVVEDPIEDCEEFRIKKVIDTNLELRNELIEIMDDELGMDFGKGKNEDLYTQVEYLNNTLQITIFENGDHLYGGIICSLIQELKSKID